MKHKNIMKSIMTFIFVTAVSLSWAKPYEYQSADLKWAPVSEQKIVVLPEKLVREYDPITIFFPDDRGPGNGGPEDEAGKYVTTTFDQPGEYRWINKRTLQFKPAEPWPVLKTFSWKIEGKFYDFYTVLTPPDSLSPYNQSTGLSDISSITLNFKQDISISDLDSIMSLEVRPLPGLDARDSIWLNNRDYEIKKQERKNYKDRYTYFVQLKRPIGVGMKLIMHLRLSLNTGFSEAEMNYEWSTRNDFRLIGMGAGSQTLPVAINGSRYNSEQALNGGDSLQVFLGFSDDLRDLSYTELKRLVSFSPAVENLTYSVYGNRVYIKGQFQRETLYQAQIQPTELQDESGRNLKMKGKSAFYFYFPKREEFLQWQKSQGVVERYGPQQMPMQGRAVDQADIRIYKIDPLDRKLWPFPSRPVAIDETTMPAGPGEEPADYSQSRDYIYESSLKEHLKMLGSPHISRIVDLPIDERSGSSQFGLDLEPYLTEISGKNKPGTYIVGFRDIKGGRYRNYVRIQVTDLSLTALEEYNGMRFYVTSFRTALPQSGVKVRLQGYISGDYSGSPEWKDLVSGTTDSKGMFFISRFSHDNVIKRLVLEKEGDIVVLNPRGKSSKYQNSYWNESEQNNWLQTLTYTVESFEPSPKGFIYTERPVYKPEEEVHIKAYVRETRFGRLSLVSGMKSFYYQIYGPGSKRWKIPVVMSANGSFYAKFDEKELPTGYYYVDLVGVKNNNATVNYSRTSFQKEAYKIPRFEVTMHGDKRVPMDREFKVSLTADYYAGGKAVDQSVNWKVTQFPYTYVPNGIKGFLFSSDSRYSLHNASFRSTGNIHKTAQTDGNGSSSITVDPTLEPNAMPRLYVFEATVTGDDEQTVSSTYDVIALPAFVLGLKVERFIQKGNVISPQILALDVEQKLMPGVEVTVRIIKREWHSHLRESPLSDGKPDYITEQVDTTLEETVVKSEKEIKELNFKVPASGIYLVELEARDELGRVQSVSADVYVGGAGTVTWEQQDEQLFRAVFDKSGSYKPGEKATILLESPFPDAMVLAITEMPGETLYDWIQVDQGKATYSIEVKNHFSPSIPIHFILVTPRMVDAEGKLLDKKLEDLGKPRTLAATKWLSVEPVENRVMVDLKHPAESMPGKTIEMDITLSDDKGKPLSGEVTLWLVDQAVLSLGEEKTIDPLASFMDSHGSHVQVYDFRNQVIGKLKVIEDPGGGYGDEEGGAPESSKSMKKMDMKESEELLDGTTVRKTFKTVAYYAPDIQVDKSGRATIKVELPDNLTIFQVRAVAVSGAERFGFKKSSINIRLPLIVQSALPRFVRYGDILSAGGLGRVVSGKGGPGSAKIKLEGATLQGKDLLSFEWDDKKAKKLFFPMTIDSPQYNQKGEIANRTLKVKLAVLRDYDKSSDAFQVQIPVMPDRSPVMDMVTTNLQAGLKYNLPKIEYTPRPGTLKQEILFTYEKGLLSAVSGMDYLLEYPHGCLEQKISKAYAAILLQKVYKQYNLESRTPQAQIIFKEAMETIEQCRLSSGLYAYWPGSEGYVYLTAYVLEFLVEAKQAGFDVPGSHLEGAKRVLKQALRSDYSGFVDAYHYQERVEALYALSLAEYFSSSYAQELAEKAGNHDLESQSRILLTLLKNKYYDKSLMDNLKKNIWDSTVFSLYQGKEMFTGMQYHTPAWGGPLNQYEIKSLAHVISSLSYGEKYSGRLKLMIDSLVNMSDINGWGNTYVNAAALRALSDYLENIKSGGENYQLNIVTGTDQSTLKLNNQTIAQSWSGSYPQGGYVELTGSKSTKDASVQMRISYVPQGSGDEVKSESKGFVVEKEMIHIKGDNAAPVKTWIKKPKQVLKLALGDIVEQHVQLINPEDRYFVVVVCPLAAGTEPMNPQLRTAPPEARPSGSISRAPSYAQYLDDEVRFYYNYLPKGTFDFYFRVKAMTEGSFVEPPAHAEMMYEEWVRGNSPGLRIEIKP